MIKKGKQVLLSSGSGTDKQHVTAQVLSDKPLQLKIEKEHIREYKANDYITLLDFETKATIINVVITSISGFTLQVNPMGELDNRQFVRVKASIELSEELMTADELDLDLDAFAGLELGQAMPEMSRIEMKNLSQTEEASEAVLYLINAVQLLDRKLEGLTSLTQQLIDRTYKAQMIRQQVSISGSGILFENDTQYDIDSRLNMRFRLSRHGASEIVVQGQVVRIDTYDSQLNDEITYGIACRFSKIREIDREQIISFAVKKQRELLRRMRADEDFS